MVGIENEQHVFRIRCNEAATLFLAGDFNDWSVTATPMQQVSPGTWEVRLRLPEGEHHFRYVTDTGRWLTDFSAPNVVANPYGGWDSVVVKRRRSTDRDDLVTVQVKATAPRMPMRTMQTGRARRSARRSRLGSLPPLALGRT